MGTSHGAFIHPRTISSLELAGPHRTAASEPARERRGSAFREGTPPSSAAAVASLFFSTIAAASSAVLAERASVPPPSFAPARGSTDTPAPRSTVRSVRAWDSWRLCASTPVRRLQRMGGGGGAHPRGACCHFVSIVARARHAIPPRAYGAPPHVAYARTGE